MLSNHQMSIEIDRLTSEKMSFSYSKDEWKEELRKKSQMYASPDENQNYLALKKIDRSDSETDNDSGIRSIDGDSPVERFGARRSIEDELVLLRQDSGVGSENAESLTGLASSQVYSQGLATNNKRFPSKAYSQQVNLNSEAYVVNNHDKLAKKEDFGSVDDDWGSRNVEENCLSGVKRNSFGKECNLIESKSLDVFMRIPSSIIDSTGDQNRNSVRCDLRLIPSFVEAVSDTDEENRERWDQEVYDAGRSRTLDSRSGAKRVQEDLSRSSSLNKEDNTRKYTANWDEYSDVDDKHISRGSARRVQEDLGRASLIKEDNTIKYSINDDCQRTKIWDEYSDVDDKHIARNDKEFNDAGRDARSRRDGRIVSMDSRAQENASNSSLIKEEDTRKYSCSDDHQRTKMWDEYSMLRSKLSEIVDQLLYKDLMWAELTTEILNFSIDNFSIEDQMMELKEQFLREELFNTSSLLQTFEMITEHQQVESYFTQQHIKHTDNEIQEKRTHLQALQRIFRSSRFKAMPKQLKRYCSVESLLSEADHEKQDPLRFLLDVDECFEEEASLGLDQGEGYEEEDSLGLDEDECYEEEISLV